MSAKKLANASVDNARISLKHSKKICREIKDKKVEKAKAMLERVISRKQSFDRKYHTNATKKILEILNSAEANAKAKMMDEDRLFVSSAKADKGRTFIRPRSLSGRRGERAKMTHIEIVLEER